MGAVVSAGPRYVVNQQLAAGGMGVVYSGTMLSPAGERPIAIKRLLDREHADANARLVAEARLVFNLTHANICQVIDLGVNDDGTFVVMELVNGVDVRSLLRRLGTRGESLDIPHALYIAREVARALDYAHRRTDANQRSLGLMHGDVTPANVLVSIEGEVKLTDFGIARAVRAVAPGTGLIAGTPGYMAPESHVTDGDHRSDIYSLGMTLYTMLVNKRPAESSNGLALRELRPEVSPELCAIVEHATAADPQARYLSARELERELSNVLARRFPGHSPSNLADSVRANMTGGVESVPVVELTSLTRTNDAVETGTTAPLGVPGTATVPPPRRRLGITILAAALLVGTAAIVLAVVAEREPEHVTAAPPTLIVPSLPLPTPTPAPEPKPVKVPTAPRVTPGPRANKSSAAKPASERPGLLTVSSVPWGVVYVDGKRVAEETPVYKLQVAAGKHSVVVFFPDRGTYSAQQRIAIDPGQTKVLGFRP